MSEKGNMNRRGLLKGSVLGAVALAMGRKSPAADVLDNCGLGATPSQVEGPFYPIEDQLDEDNDLTVNTENPGQSQGEVVFIKGHVQDESCRPLKGVLVEIWQACASGRYNHPEDPNSARLDPHFQYWGQALTNEKGEYLFKTIKPGSYPASSNWTRPPHIHFKIKIPGPGGSNTQKLITQMYFEGEPLNARDNILNSLKVAERKKLIVSFKEEVDANGQVRKVGHFPIILKKTPFLPD